MSIVSRTTVLNDGALLSAIVFGDKPHRASVSISSSVSTVQIGVILSREQLVEHRDAINAVLVQTEGEAS